MSCRQVFQKYFVIFALRKTFQPEQEHDFRVYISIFGYISAFSGIYQKLQNNILCIQLF